MHGAATEGKVNVSARIIRADGTVHELGRINGRFPWRLWLYRLRNRKDA